MATVKIKQGESFVNLNVGKNTTDISKENVEAALEYVPANKEEVYSKDSVDALLSNLSIDVVHNNTLDSYYDKTHIDTEIQALQNNIDNLELSSDLTVEDVANKIGATYYSVENTTMYFFKNAADKQLWIDAGCPKTSVYILDSTQFEFSSKQYQINLTNNNGSNLLYFTNDSIEAVLSLTPSTRSKTISDTEWSNVNEDYTVTVQYDKHTQGTWEDIVINQNLVSGDAYTLDVIDFIDTVASRFKISFVGTVSGVITSFIYSVTLTSMYLQASNFNWQTPFIEGSEFSVGGMLIGGSISKTLYIKMSNADGYSLTYNVNIGTNTYTSNAYYFNGLDFPSSGTGVYNLDIWLDGGSVVSEHLSYNIICVSKADEFTSQLVAVSNVSDKIINYYDNDLFDFVIYNKGISTGSVTLKVYQITHNIPSLLLEETLQNVATSVVNTYLKNIEIESEEADMTLYAEVIYGNEQKINLVIDNSYNFPPTSGASFYMNPSSRSNTQENKEYIVNEINDANIEATFNRLTWADGADGWTVDEYGRKCLRLPATTSVDIQYCPLETVGNGKTISFTYRVTNVSNYNKPIIYCCTNINSPTFQGFIIYPTQVIVHTKERNSVAQNSVQSYNLKEEENVNLQISIIKNYKTSYGNLCIIYVNGVKKCEFSFSNYDNWEITNNLHFGSDYADLFVYNMHVYNIAFGFSNSITNYINSLRTLEERIECRDSNKSIVNDDYEIEFDRVKEVANYGVIEVLGNGRLPQYGLTKTYTTWCNWEQHYHDHPTWDFKITDCELSGQGTTSMNYKWWNLRARTDKGTTQHVTAVEYPNNEIATVAEGDITVKLDGGIHPAVTRITAKKNYASSMQSHKMGANLAFNDLHDEVVGPNEVGGRVGLYQYPFYMFQKIKIDGTETYTYKFIGLYTIGPDKGDKATYGYDQDDVKDDLLVLEGVDHDKQLAIFKYPWTDETVTYNSTLEGASIIKDNDNYEKGWDVTNAGSAKTDDAILAKLVERWKPAYNVAYLNNPFLLYLDEDSETLETLNSAEWRTRFTLEGHSYQRYEVWRSSNYHLYYYSVTTQQYEDSGINVLTDLGLTELDVIGMTLDEKNSLFIQKRKERFATNWTTYFHKDDTLFHYVCLYIMGATDNLAKNTYPYILGTFENGYKWRWRQDDLDTIFDIDNQGHSVKTYSIEPDDWTDDNHTAYVYKGEDSVFWTLIRDTQQTNIKLMGKRILQGMYNLSQQGLSTIEKLIGFFHTYFWNNAQEYFTKTAYNIDAELIYEDAWPLYENGSYSVDVNPLEQSLGDHIEAEQAWVEKRLIYCMSKFQYTPFNDYSDTCLGRITIRTQYQQGFTLTPAIDMYPVILSGQGTILGATERINSGEDITFAGAGGTNTNIYIMAADYIKSLGDLKDLQVDATTSASLTLGAKRLESIKLGDEDASKVTGNLQQLAVGDSPSIITIDCRNLTSLTGSLDLSKAPRLKYLYLGNTDVRTVIIANGARITTIQLPDSIQTINFNNLKYLENGNTETMTGLIYSDTAVRNIEYLRVENCTSLNAYDILKACYKSGNTLKDIRVVNFECNGTLEDFDILGNISKNKSYFGDTVNYRGIDANGNIVTTLHPIIEGTFNIDGAAYKDSVEAIRSYFYNMVLNINGGYYIRFADDYIKNILLANNMGGEDGHETDIHENKLKTITNQQLFDWFSITKATDTSSSSIDKIYLAANNGEYFNELEECTGITELKYTGSNGVFTNYTKLKEVTLPRNCTKVNYYTFDGCTSLEKVNMNKKVTGLYSYAFRNCSSLKVFEFVDTLTTASSTGLFTGCTGIEKLIISMTPEHYCNLSLGGTTNNIAYINKDKDNFGIYTDENTQLTNFVIPESISIIRDYSFQAWKNITFENILNNNVIQKIGNYSFQYCNGLTGNLNLPILNTLGTYSFQYSGISGFKADTLAILPQQCFEYCSNLETVDVKNLTQLTAGGQFRYCTKLKSVSLDNVEIITGGAIFKGCTSLEEIILPKIQSGNTFGSEVFTDCTSLKKVQINTADTINQISLPSSTFKNCTSLETVILPKGFVFSSGSNSHFENCTSLKYIYVSSRSITASSVFKNCTNLSTSKYLGTITYVYSNAWNSMNKKGHTLDFSECTASDPMLQYYGWVDKSIYRVVVPDSKYDSWLNSSPNMLSTFAWRLMKQSEYEKQPTLNYVQFNGAQSYDSGIHCTGYMKFDLFMEMGTSTSGQTWLFGQRTGFNQSTFTDTPDTYGLCIDGTFRLRAGQYNDKTPDNQKLKYYPLTYNTPTSGSTNIGTITTSSVLTLHPVSNAYGWALKLKGGFDGFEGGCKWDNNNMSQYIIKSSIVKAFDLHDPDYSNLTTWIGSVNNNGVTADTNLAFNAKIFYLKFYYTYYYIHTLYDTQSDCETAATGNTNVKICTTEDGKYYFTAYDTGISNADYRIYTNKYITRELAEAAATGNYIITSNDEEVRDFRPYKYVDDDGVTHVTFKDRLTGHVCENLGVSDGIYGEY